MLCALLSMVFSVSEIKGHKDFFKNVFADICRPLFAFIYRDPYDVNLVIFVAI